MSEEMLELPLPAGGVGRKTELLGHGIRTLSCSREIQVIIFLNTVGQLVD